MNSRTFLCIASIALSLGACASLAPSVPEPVAEIPATWPLPATTGEAGSAAPGDDPRAAADIGWRDFFADPQLQALIERALEHNRDLRVAALNIERARAQYGIQRADQLPALGAAAIASRGGGGGNPAPDAYSASFGLADFELDFFGRVRDLRDAALQQYLAQTETRRTAQLVLIGEVANAWLRLAADRALLAVAQSTLANQNEAFRLTEKRHELGAISGLDLAQARTTVESARADVARFAGQVTLDINALNLLTGRPGTAVPAAPDFERVLALGIPTLPAGLPSEVLLRRPDVMAAEHRLRAASASIGAARAAFFPSIRLTASVGTASSELSGIASSGSGFWALRPSLNLPIFDNGRLQGNLELAKADQEIALAQYERAIQSGFREVSDALSLTRSLAGQREAQQALVEAATRANEISLARYQAGRDPYQTALIAQRALYGAQQALIATRLAEQGNRVTLYKVLGGGWRERNP